MQLSGSSETAAEVTQQAFLALMPQNASLDGGRSALLSWLYAIARRYESRSMRTARPRSIRASRCGR